MRKFIAPLFATIVILFGSCSNDKEFEKGFQVSTSAEETKIEDENGIQSDSLKFETQPGNVILTGVKNIRLTPVYKVNISEDNKSRFTGSNNYYSTYDDGTIDPENNWNNNLMPGLEAVYGYNMVNLSHYDNESHKQKTFFAKPVLIKTLYLPSYSNDTLFSVPVKRNFFILSVYNEDTNKDGFINLKDLRRLYLFNINAEKIKALVPENYSVFKSDYDPINDQMHIYAGLDQNKNGTRDKTEPIHIFWIDLKDPTKTGRQY